MIPIDADNRSIAGLMETFPPRAAAEGKRTLQDLADVAYLLRTPGVDRSEVRGYLERAGLRSGPRGEPSTLDDPQRER